MAKLGARADGPFKELDGDAEIRISNEIVVEELNLVVDQMTVRD